MDTNKNIELHSYYICRQGFINGVELYSRDFVTIKGPFIDFNTHTRILTTNNNKIYLPTNYADVTYLPPVYQRTCEFLNNICVN